MTPVPALSKPIRITAAIIGVISVIATLVLVTIRELVPGSDGSYLSTFWALLRYFTILTNAIVSYVLIMAAIRGHWRSFSLLTGAALWISLVGVIYHVMLADDHNPAGLAAMTNHMHHTIVPLGTFLIWIMARPRAFISRRAPFVWLIFPLFYTFYMVVRAELLGDIYPYPFSDASQIGWKQFFITQGVLICVFLGLGFLFRWLSNFLGRSHSSTHLA